MKTLRLPSDLTAAVNVLLSVLGLLVMTICVLSCDLSRSDSRLRNDDIGISQGENGLPVFELTKNRGVLIGITSVVVKDSNGAAVWKAPLWPDSGLRVVTYGQLPGAPSRVNSSESIIHPPIVSLSINGEESTKLADSGVSNVEVFTITISYSFDDQVACSTAVSKSFSAVADKTEVKP